MHRHWARRPKPRLGLGRAIRACGLAETVGMVTLINQEFDIAIPLFLLTCRRGLHGKRA